MNENKKPSSDEIWRRAYRSGTIWKPSIAFIYGLWNSYLRPHGRWRWIIICAFFSFGIVWDYSGLLAILIMAFALFYHSPFSRS